MLYGVAAQFCDWIVGICEATCENLRQRADGTTRAHRAGIQRATALLRGSDEERRHLRDEAERDHRPGVERSGFDLARSEGAGANRAGRTVLLFVGRLALIKDLATMIRAFAGVSKERDDLRLWIVGDGPERGRLEDMARELGVAHMVRFWGERHDVAQFFSAADVFAMSSVSEGIADVAPAGDVHRHACAGDGCRRNGRGGAPGGRGLTTRVGDSAAMAEAMLTLAERTEQRDRFGARAYAAYAESFTLETMDETYMSLYRKKR